MNYSDTTLVAGPGPSPALQLSWLPRFLRIATLSLMVVALAGPQWIGGLLPVAHEGVDIVIALDLSGSMRAEDLRPNRVGAAKAVAEEFVSGRPSDRIGLVAFAGEAYSQCPLTLDHDMLTGILRNLNVGYIQDGTAIGMALAEAGARLKNSRAASKVVILLTDGVNNRGAIDPRTAAEVLKALNIRVDTIGIGSREGGRVPVGTDFLGRPVYSSEVMELDEALLKDIAATTGGGFFIAHDTGKLKAIFSTIDRMEKTAFSGRVPRIYTEAYRFFLFPTFALLLLEVFLSTTRFRRFP